MSTESQILNVPIEDIIPNRFQPRLNFDENGLKELAASIKEHGIIQPLVLRRIGDKFEIIAGERRYKASKMAGLTSVPAIIAAIDDKKSAEVAIVENVQRRDLSAIEEAKSYKSLLDKGYLTQEELAKKMGLSQSAISNKLRLLSLTESVQNALMSGKISERHARSLLQLDDTKEQDEWLNKILEERLTVRELDKRIKSIKNDNLLNNDIVNNKELEQSINNVVNPEIEISTSTPSQEIIPNKFFNYLEDEQVNMSIEESDSITEAEEIELLDFSIPTPTIVTEYLQKDMSVANGLIDKVVTELKNSNYIVTLEKDEKTNEIKYIINIEKN